MCKSHLALSARESPQSQDQAPTGWLASFPNHSELWTNSNVRRDIFCCWIFFKIKRPQGGLHLSQTALSCHQIDLENDKNFVTNFKHTYFQHALLLKKYSPCQVHPQRWSCSQSVRRLGHSLHGSPCALTIPEKWQRNILWILLTSMLRRIKWDVFWSTIHLVSLYVNSLCNHLCRTLASNLK